MGKLLRVLVVFLLLLGIAALVLGFLLFQKRETLKGHVQDLSVQVERVAANIEAEQADDLTKTDNPKMNKEITAVKLQGYSLDPVTKKANTNAPMMLAMAQLVGKSAIELSRLNDTRTALALKIKELETATNRIAVLEANVAKLEGEKKQLQDNVASLEKDVAEKKTKIEELNASLDEAKSKITDLQEQVAKLKDSLLDRDDQIKTLKETIVKLTPKVEGPTAGTAGTKGKIVLVNKNWNFVVIAVNEAIGTGVELTIQRGDKLIGKVRVSDLNPQYQLAIGDVLLDWKQADVEVGDYVFY
jgi:chromosome segregation ATPase